MDNLQNLFVLGQAGFTLENIPLGPFVVPDILKMLIATRKNISPVLATLLRRAVVDPGKPNDTLAVQKIILSAVSGERSLTIGLSPRFIPLFLYFDPQPENPKIAFTRVRMVIEGGEKFDLLDNTKLRTPEIAKRAAEAAWAMIDRDAAFPVAESKTRARTELVEFQTFHKLFAPDMKKGESISPDRMPLEIWAPITEEGAEEVVQKEINAMGPRQRKREQLKIEARYRVWISDPDAEAKARKFDLVDVWLHRKAPAVGPSPDKAPEPIQSAGEDLKAILLERKEGWQSDPNVLRAALGLVRTNDETAIYVAEECLLAQGRDVKHEIWLKKRS